jgi:H+/Cl- antiporter ClcA
MQEEQADLGVAGWAWLIGCAAGVGLCIGALGTAFRVCLHLGDHARDGLVAIAIAGMAAFFTATIRSKLTGIYEDRGECDGERSDASHVIPS